MKMRLPAYAKINLYLDIMEKRTDGFHDIKSIMHTVSLSDNIVAESFDCGDERTIILESDGDLPTDKNNLVWRAADRFFEYFHINRYKVRFQIEKNIPISAGLAGGSSDAAAAIKLLNKLYDVNASTDELCKIGAEIGSDVPFCILGGTCAAYGRGEKLEKIDSNARLRLLIANGGEGVSTPAAYKRADEIYNDSLKEDFGDINKVKLAIEKDDIKTLSKYAYNAFEEIVLPIHSEAANAKKIMLCNGAVHSMLCGSGPSVFGIFEDAASRDKAFDVLKESGYRVFACETQIES